MFQSQIDDGALVFGGIAQAADLQIEINQRAAVADVLGIERQNAIVEIERFLRIPEIPTKVCSPLQRNNCLAHQIGAFFEIGALDQLGTRFGHESPLEVCI